MKRSRFPAGWNEARVRRLLEHYERQSEAEALAEDEATLRRRDQTVIVVPKRLVPAITKLIQRQTRIARSRRRRNPASSAAPRKSRARRKA
ncbi:MAG: hypothetical protein HYR85_25860 [Planctomycetes bacterium]|nr:hypothetical protein [Planctomycetota bacterium]